MRIRVRLRHLPACTVLALIALEAGIAPSRIWEMPFLDFAAEVMKARQARLS